VPVADVHDEALAHVQALRKLLATLTHRSPRGDYTTLDVVRENLGAVEWVVRLHDEVARHDASVASTDD
jgi:hypothetical protein